MRANLVEGGGRSSKLISGAAAMEASVERGRQRVALERRR